MQSLSSKSSNTTSKKTLPANTRTQRGGLRTTNKHGYHVRIMEDEKDSINNSSNSLSIGGEDEDGQPVDKTVYETAGIIDRIDRLKARVEGELSKEASKSRWFSECQRSIEEKKVIKKPEHVDYWAQDKPLSTPSSPSLSSASSQKTDINVGTTEL